MPPDAKSRRPDSPGPAHAARMAPEARGPEIELEITDLARGGAGVGREQAGGRAIFVPYTLAGDRIRARVTREQKRFAHAELVEILQPSADRRAPPCAVFGRCGGCQWQHVPYAIQWRTKLAGLRQALARVGVEAPGALTEFPAEEEWFYRNRVQLRGDGEKLGYYAAGTHEIVAIGRCEIARPEINAGLAAIRDRGRLMPPYKVELEVGSDGTLASHWNLPHAAGGFRQVNDRQNGRLREWVDDRLREETGVLYDLFGGSGNLSRLPAARMARTHCVDLSVRPPENVPTTMQFHVSDVRAWVRRFAAGVTGPAEVSPRGACAIVDPPREGLGSALPEISAGLRRLGASRLICVGCDVDAWARDLRGWSEDGWRIEEAGALDFFPQTPHLEALAVFSRS